MYRKTHKCSFDGLRFSKLRLGRWKLHSWGLLLNVSRLRFSVKFVDICFTWIPLRICVTKRPHIQRYGWLLCAGNFLFFFDHYTCMITLWIYLLLTTSINEIETSQQQILFTCMRGASSTQVFFSVLFQPILWHDLEELCPCQGCSYWV